LITGASSALTSMSATSASSLLGLASPSVTASLTGALQRVEAADQRLDVLLGGDGDAAVERGGDLDVVDREHVGRVGHRHQQRLLVDEADRQAPGSGAPC
jgi:hypothetical protein